MTDQRSPLDRRATRRGMLKTTAALGALGALGGLLAACGGSDAASPAPAQPTAAGTGAAPGLSDEQVRAILAKRIDEEKRGVGLVVGRIWPGGRSIVSHGAMSRGQGQEVGADTIFEIGSISKAFTGVLLAAMIANQELALDDPIARWLPAPARAPERGGAQITLRHLVTHTSGLPRLPDGFAPADPDNPYADYTVEHMYDFLARYRLPRDIGAEYEYSNLGMGLLGHILALRAGSDYETLVKSRIGAPLGMKDTTIALSAGQPLAAGHDALGDPAPNWDLPTLAGAGGLRSTAADMLAFLAANMGLTQTALLPALQASHAPLHTMAPEAKIAMAWHIISAPGGEIVWHNGGTGGYASFIGFDAKRGLGVVVLSNQAIPVDDLALHLLDQSYPLQAPPAARTRAQVDPQILARYAGEYQLAPDFILTVTAGQDSLTVQATGQGPLTAHPESETGFFLTEVDAQLTFEVDGAGQPTGVVLHQGGQNTPGKKIK